MPEDFIVGPTGLPLWRYQDWRARREDRWREAYGADADVRPETPDGLIIDTLALGDTLQGDATQSVWANSFFRTASGVGLDLLLDMFGRLRLPAEPTEVQAVWYGDAGSVVWDGLGSAPVVSVVSVGASDLDRYAIQVAGTIPSPDDDGAIVVFRFNENRATIGDDYGIEFDGAEAVVTAADDDELVVATALAAEIEVTFPTFTATAWAEPSGAAVVVIQGKGTEVVAIGNSTTAPSAVALFGGVTLTMAAELTGAQQVLAGSLVTVETPGIAGLEGVVNLEDGDLGRDLETDAAYRIRHIDQINIGGKGTPQRIRAALLELGEDLVEFARVDENVTSVVVEGRPAHSFEATVIGDATDEEIAAVVFDQKPAGIRSFGTTEVAVTDDVGDLHRIQFSRGTELYLHLAITVTSGEGFPTTGDPEAAIESAVVQYLEDTLVLGQDFYRYALGFPILSTVQGVVSVAITADSTPAPGDAPTLVAADLTVASNEVLRVSSTRITVTVV